MVCVTVWELIFPSMLPMPLKSRDSRGISGDHTRKRSHPASSHFLKEKEFPYIYCGFSNRKVSFLPTALCCFSQSSEPVQLHGFLTTIDWSGAISTFRHDQLVKQFLYFTKVLFTCKSCTALTIIHIANLYNLLSPAWMQLYWYKRPYTGIPFCYWYNCVHIRGYIGITISFKKLHP